MKRISTALLLLILSTAFITAIDNPHFYRANFFWNEPRFETPWLSSVDMHIAGGSSRTGRDSDGHHTPLHNIYGFQNMRLLGNSPGLDPANPLDEILINLSQVPVPEDSLFSNLEYRGRFEMVEIIFDAYQNLCNGFFIQAYFPMRHLKQLGTNIFVDRTPDDLQNNPQWLAFLNNFPAIQRRYSLSTQPSNQNGFGDFTLLAGWARNYDQTCTLDYVDFSAKIGVLFPTGKTVNFNNVFELPTGYNGFYGVPLKFDLSIGHWDWLTLGCHIGALFLLKKDTRIRIQTVEDQPAYFLLFKEEAEVDPGTYWEAATYIKADRFFKGLSLLFGYCFTQKEQDCIQLMNNDTFNRELANRNLLRDSWDMHVLHFMAEWDFARKASDIGPRVGFFYNLVVGGRRIFNTAIKDAYGGIDLQWCI